MLSLLKNNDNNAAQNSKGKGGMFLGMKKAQAH